MKRSQVPSDEHQYWQTSDACATDHRAAVQRKTVHMRRLAHGAKRDMKLKYRTVVLEVLSRLPRRDRVPHSGVEDSADHAVARSLEGPLWKKKPWGAKKKTKNLVREKQQKTWEREQQKTWKEKNNKKHWGEKNLGREKQQNALGRKNNKTLWGEKHKKTHEGEKKTLRDNKTLGENRKTKHLERKKRS